MVVIWPGLEGFVRLEFWRTSSEKGNTRKRTGNRVTSWSLLFWGNLGNLRCFTKRIYLEEFEISDFWGFGRESTWGY
jgi:hypothetical protein